MEKIKNFVIKYQLWFKLAAIALLICVVFTPLILSESYDTRYTVSIWEFIKNYSANINNMEPKYAVHWNLSWVIFFLTIIILILLCLSFWKKHLLKLSCFLYILDFGIILVAAIFACKYEHGQYEENDFAIPFIAFFIAALLFILTLLLIHYIIKNNKSISKTERIAQLEKRIEQLEQERDSE